MMSHSITFHSVYFELSTVPKRETMKGINLYSPLQPSPGVKFDFPREKSQKIAINRNKSQKNRSSIAIFSQMKKSILTDQ